MNKLGATKSKLLFATNPWAFQTPGGGEQILLDSYYALVSRGHHVDLYDSWHHYFTDYELVHYFHCPGWEIWDRIKSAGLRLIVTPTMWWDSRGRCWLAKELRYLAHHFTDRWWPPPLDERVARRHLMVPDLLLPASMAEAARLHRYLEIPWTKMRIVKNGCHPGTKSVSDLSNGELRQILLQDKVLLCVGSFHPVKNQLGLINALRSTDFRVMFIGEPYIDCGSSYLAECKKVADGQHYFFSRLTHDSVLEVMNCARVYVQPSMRETCGLAALEAGASGARVVITENGATREYFSKFAWYLNPMDAHSIRRAVESAWFSPNDLPLREHIASNHSLTRVAVDLEQAYAQVLR